MPGQIIGTVNVQVNKQQNSTVRQLNYGIRSLKGGPNYIANVTINVVDGGTFT